MLAKLLLIGFDGLLLLLVLVRRGGRTIETTMGTTVATAVSTEGDNRGGGGGGDIGGETGFLRRLRVHDELTAVSLVVILIRRIQMRGRGRTFLASPLSYSFVSLFSSVSPIVSVCISIRFVILIRRRTVARGGVVVFFVADLVELEIDVRHGKSLLQQLASLLFEPLATTDLALACAFGVPRIDRFSSCCCSSSSTFLVVLLGAGAGAVVVVLGLALLLLLLLLREHTPLLALADQILVILFVFVFCICIAQLRLPMRGLSQSCPASFNE